MKIIRYEPCLGEYILQHEGEVYSFKSKDLSKIKEDLDSYRILNIKDKVDYYSRPINVQIQVTNTCNFNCITCAVACKKNKELSYEKIKETIKGIADMGVLNLEWSGGEPFCRFRFKELVEYAHSLGLEQNILTNGTVFTKDNIEWIKKYFYKIQVSLDNTEDKFEKIIRKPFWNMFVKSMKLAIKHGLPIKFASVLQKDNVDDFDKIIKFTKDIGIKTLRIGLQVSMGNSNHGWDDYKKILDKFKKNWLKLNKGGLNIDCFLDKVECKSDGNKLVSPGGNTMLYIDSIGDIYPFPFMYYPELKIGTIKDNLIDIWQNNKILKKLRNYKGCPNCNLECAFNSRSVVYSYTKNLTGKPVSCLNI